VLESLLLLKHLPQGTQRSQTSARAAGLPIIPCLIARADLEATLIESSQKKAVFLREALERQFRSATIIAGRLRRLSRRCFVRHLSRAGSIHEKIRTLIDWAPAGSTLLLFGGETLREQLQKANVSSKILIPLSEKRFLFLATAH
jgi:16S rRNA G527 N7-methylase RsmG